MSPDMLASIDGAIKCDFDSSTFIENGLLYFFDGVPVAEVCLHQHFDQILVDIFYYERKLRKENGKS